MLQRRYSKRRGSVRRSPSRRLSSPFGSDMDRNRRRSSTMTIASGETQISMEEDIPEEEIIENIRMHKEVLESVKTQAWRTRKKLKVARQAKTYVKKHEDLLEQRLAQSKSTKDIMARYKLIFYRVLAADRLTAGDRKELLPTEAESAFNLHSIWEFEGWLKYSPLFYGYYTDKDKTKAGYRLPFAYFMASIGMYAYSFWAILKKMAKNSRMSKLSEKDEECTFTWKLFAGWDYMIGNSETSQNKVASLVMGFKEVVLEEQEKQKESYFYHFSWKIIVLRVIANIMVMCLLAASAYAVVKVVERSQQPDGESGWWRKNELQVVLNGIGALYPNLFEVIAMMESFHPRVQLQIQLSRIWVLNMLNLYTLNLALFDKVEKMVSIGYVNTSKGVFNFTGQHPNCTIIIVLCDNMTSSFTPIYPIINFTLSPDQDIYTNTTLEYWQLPYIDGNDIYLQLPNLTSILEDTSGPVFIDTTVSITNNETNWISPQQLEFTTKIHPGLKSMSLIFLPPELLAKYNLSNTSLEYNMSLFPINDTDFAAINFTDYTDTLTNIISDWISTTVFPDLADMKNVTMLITASVRTDEDNEIPTLEPSTVLTTVIPISLTDAYELNVSSATAKICFQVVCPEIVDYTEGDVYSETDIVTWLSTQSLETTNASSGYCNNCTDYVTPEEPTTLMIIAGYELDMETRIKLRKLCWETMFGQVREIVRLTVMDLAFTTVMTLAMDFFRAVFVRVMNRCWCWDLEKQFPGYGDFKIAENILHLINNQGMIWMGTFFSPGLPIINAVKLVMLFYIRSWAVLTCNVPHETVFRASRSNNFYYALLLTMLFLCTLPVSYAVIWLKPSWHCGPFSGYFKIYHILTQSVKSVMPDVVNRALDYLTSASIVIPLMLLLILIIYYLLSLARSLREANKDLKNQLRRERTEERKKVLQMAEGHQPGTDMASKWPAVMKKILPVLPNKKTLPDVEKLKQDSVDSKDENGDVADKKKSQSRLILMSDDDIFIETDNNSSRVIITDETHTKKDVKSTEVPTITISKVKDDDKNDKKRSKDEKKKKDEKKSKEDKKIKKKLSEEETESDQKSLLEKDKKKKKEEEKMKKEELKRKKEEEKKKKEEEKKKKEEEKKKKDGKIKKEDKNKKDEEKSKIEEKKKEKVQEKKKEKLQEEKTKEKTQDEKIKKKIPETKIVEKEILKAETKPEKKSSVEKSEPEPQILQKHIEKSIEKVESVEEKTEEIEMGLLSREESESISEDVKPESDSEESKRSILKGDGIFEKDTTPLVIEFGTPESIGSFQSSTQ
uniref:TMC domain-containing protein n=1 Tax=Strigamia maritima TaxID=126957 RepID=T1J1A4_STRMM